MTPFDKQSELAHEASEIIIRMPATAGNLQLVLQGLIKAVSDVSWCDTSLVLHHLEEAACALTEVRAVSEEEHADGVRESMQTKRGEE